MNNSLKKIDSKDIKSMIHEVRGKQVLLDSDLAILYKCANGTKTLNLAVKRNIARFPERFCFQLTQKEYDNLRFQNETSSLVEEENHGGRRYLPYVFTEQGVAMLASVLRTNVATEISIKIMDAFVEMRKFIINNAHVFERLTNVEYKLLEHDKNFDKVFDLLQKDKEFKNKLFFDGQIYDAYILIVDILKRAKKEIVIIDNYIDNKILRILSEKEKGVDVIIITNNVKLNELNMEKFISQYGEIKVNFSNKFHDRFIIIDSKELYHIGASIKDLGKKCFGITKIEDSEYLTRLNKKIDDIKIFC